MILRMEKFVLNRSHTIKFALLSLFITVSVFIVFIYFAGLYVPDIIVPILILLITGLFVGSFLPGILATWLIIILTTIGITILVLGQMLLPQSSKVLLILIFPVAAGLMLLNRNLLGSFSSKNINQKQMESYIYHYDQVTRLQGKYNAEKIYKKIVNFIINDVDQNLLVHATAIHWSHSDQFRQFHPDEYNKTLHEVSQVLKDKRLSEESLYYLGDGSFLVISYEASNDKLLLRNQLTKDSLNDISLLQTKPQFKWGSLKVNRDNADKFSTLDEVIKHLERMMEKDLVIEYLKEVTD